MIDRKKQSKLDRWDRWFAAAWFLLLLLCFWGYAVFNDATGALLTLGPIERTYTVEELVQSPPEPGTRIAVEPARLEWGAERLQGRGRGSFAWWLLSAPESAKPGSPGVVFLHDGTIERFAREPATGRDRFVGHAWPAADVLSDTYTADDYTLPGVDVQNAWVLVDLDRGHTEFFRESMGLIAFFFITAAFMSAFGGFGTTSKRKQGISTSWKPKSVLVSLLLTAGAVGFSAYQNHSGLPSGIKPLEGGEILLEDLNDPGTWAMAQATFTVFLLMFACLLLVGMPVDMRVRSRIEAWAVRQAPDVKEAENVLVDDEDTNAEGPAAAAIRAIEAENKAERARERHVNIRFALRLVVWLAVCGAWWVLASEMVRSGAPILRHMYQEMDVRQLIASPPEPGTRVKVTNAAVGVRYGRGGAGFTPGSDVAVLAQTELEAVKGGGVVLISADTGGYHRLEESGPVYYGVVQPAWLLQVNDAPSRDRVLRGLDLKTDPALVVDFMRDDRWTGLRYLSVVFAFGGAIVLAVWRARELDTDWRGRPLVSEAC